MSERGYTYLGQDKKLSGSVYCGAGHWGQLRDSDTFKNITTSHENLNYCVSFETPVP